MFKPSSRQCILIGAILFGLGQIAAHGQQWSWFARSADEEPHQTFKLSRTSDGGFLLGTIHSGAAVVTRYGSGGLAQWSKEIRNGDLPIGTILTLEEIDGGPGFFLFGTGVAHVSSSVHMYYLLEVSGSFDIEFCRSYYDALERCGLQVLYGERMGSASRLPQGGYMFNMSSHGQVSCVVRTNETGDTLSWRQHSAGVVSSPANYQFQSFSSTGLSDGTLLLMNSVGGGFNIQRVDTENNILWSKTYRTGNYADQAMVAQEAPDDSIVVAGIHAVSSGGDYWSFLLKIDLDGNIGWHRRINMGTATIVSGGFPRDLSLDAAGNILLHTTRPTNYEVLIRANPQGVVQEVYDMDMGGGYDEGVELCFLTSGSILLGGSYQNDSDPNWVESPFAITTASLSEIPCQVQASTWFDEPYPGPIDILNDGATRWEPYPIVLTEPVTIQDVGWTFMSFCLSTDVNGMEPNDRSITAFPNPTLVSTGIFISHEGPITSIQLFDHCGRQLPVEWRTTDIGVAHVPLDLMSAGSYSLVISAGGSMPSRIHLVLGAQ